MKEKYPTSTVIIDRSVLVVRCITQAQSKEPKVLLAPQNARRIELAAGSLMRVLLEMKCAEFDVFKDDKEKLVRTIKCALMSAVSLENHVFSALSENHCVGLTERVRKAVEGVVTKNEWEKTSIQKTINYTMFSD